MSLATRYYEFCYGSLPTEAPLTPEQWREIERRAHTIHSRKYELLTAILQSILVFFGLGALLTRALSSRVLMATYLIWVPLVLACIYLSIHALNVLLLRPHISLAAAQLGYVHLCPCCGYSLTGLPEDCDKCPECGATTAARGASS